jgi:hypothetical protein
MLKLQELTTATAEDEAAKREALQMGLDATLPLSTHRLEQLCNLGERMMQTARRKATAETAVAEMAGLPAFRPGRV